MRPSPATTACAAVRLLSCVAYGRVCPKGSATSKPWYAAAERATVTTRASPGARRKCPSTETWFCSPLCVVAGAMSELTPMWERRPAQNPDQYLLCTTTSLAARSRAAASWAADRCVSGGDVTPTRVIVKWSGAAPAQLANVSRTAITDVAGTVGSQLPGEDVGPMSTV